MIRVEIITIGNELLLGSVLDSNSNWLCKQLNGLGAQVTRIVLVQDNIQEITRELLSAKDRGAQLVFTLGGLGPTDDDLTLQAIAYAFHLDLGVNDWALQFVSDVYKKFYEKGYVTSSEMTKSREKMAILPKDSTPLPNNVGAAPGVLTHLDTKLMIVSLPGVPREMKDIFTNSLNSVLKSVLGYGGYFECMIFTDCGDETVLSPILHQVTQAMPGVYIKSRVKTFGENIQIGITISARAEIQSDASKKVENTIKNLKEALNRHGINIVDETKLS
jgi:nicotinamide-nucleotide amidase